MIDFWCSKDGKTVLFGLGPTGQEFVKIQIPEECCGNKISIKRHGDEGTPSFINGMCKVHLSTYRDIWNNFGPKEEKMLDFWTYEMDGDKYVYCDTRRKTVKIQLPEICCGIKTEIISIGNEKEAGKFVNVGCSKHMCLWKDIWKNFGSCKKEAAYGVNCIKCGEYNEYAEVVVGFKCYGCRVSL